MTHRIPFLILAAAGTILAQRPGGLTPPVAEVKSYLALTDTQITALNTIRQQSFQALQAAHQDIAVKHKALADLLAAGTTDANAVGKAVLEIQALHKKLADAQKPFQDQAAAVLTADQKTKLKVLDEASKLRLAIQQAVGLLLLTPPRDFGPGIGMGPAMGPARGPMGMGPGPGGPGMMRHWRQQ